MVGRAPAAEQCEGCTFYTAQVGELSYLHSRDITYAVLCQGPYDESIRYRDFMGWDMPWYSAQDSLGTLLTGRQIGLFHLVCYLRDGNRVFETYWTERRGVEAMDYSYALMDLTVYGRQERWEDSPAGGRRNAPTRGPTAARLPGRPCPSRRPDAPSASGRDSKRATPTTSPPRLSDTDCLACDDILPGPGSFCCHDDGTGRTHRALAGHHPHPEPAEVVTARLLRAADVTVTGVDIDELDAALTTGPQHGRDLAQAAARIEFTVAGTAEPRICRPGIGYALALALGRRCAGPGGRPADGPARGPRSG